MSIQGDWKSYCRNFLSEFAEELTESHVILLRHAFFSGASVSYTDVYTSTKSGGTREVMIAIHNELEMFMAERNDSSIRLH